VKRDRVPVKDVERRAVESSAICSVGYVAETQTLEIEFLSGVVYRYVDVPSIVARGLIEAESIGRFFNRHVRSTFSHVRA